MVGARQERRVEPSLSKPGVEPSGEAVTVERFHGAPPLAAFVARPARPNGAGVLVLHELLGLNDDIRRIARRFADHGYVALAPDLFSGRGARPLCIARTIAALRRHDGPAFDDLEAARQWLCASGGVAVGRVGVAGFCMGGGFALLFAARAPIAVAAPYYGDVPKSADALDGVCPVVAGFGGRDRVFGRGAVRLDALLDELGVEHDVRVYERAGHSYMSRHEPDWLLRLAAAGPMHVGYDEEAAEDSWIRMLDYFERHLGVAQ